MKKKKQKTMEMELVLPGFLDPMKEEDRFGGEMSCDLAMQTLCKTANGGKWEGE